MTVFIAQLLNEDTGHACVCEVFDTMGGATDALDILQPIFGGLIVMQSTRACVPGDLVELHY